MIGASLSEPHIDELNVRNLYIIIYIYEPHIDELNVRNLYIIIYIYMVRPSPARRYIHCTATRDIFRRPHEETSALSGTTCTIIAESAKYIALVSEPTVSRKAKWQQTLIAILVMLPLYLECLYLSAKLFVNDLWPQCCIKHC